MPRDKDALPPQARPVARAMARPTIKPAAKSIEPLKSAPDPERQAAFALGQLRDARAIDGLTAALKDASADVRQQAAFALGQLAR